MDEQLTRLVDKAWDQYKALPNSKRLLIAIGGIPGSGKTTFATRLTSALNARFTQHQPCLAAGTPSPLAALVPMDGFHYSRAELAAMPDPETAFARRGAAFTFDARAYAELVKRLREPIMPETGTIMAPSFDHAVKDPVAGDVRVAPGVKIVVLEGNYVALGQGTWREACELMDEVWFVECEEDIARRRLVKRHVAAGISSDADEAGKRVEENDLVNGREIVKGRYEGLTEVIKSVEGCAGWA